MWKNSVSTGGMLPRDLRLTFKQPDRLLSGYMSTALIIAFNADYEHAAKVIARALRDAQYVVTLERLTETMEPVEF